MRRVIRTATVAIFLYALLNLLAGIEVAEITLHPQRRALDQEAIAEAQAGTLQNHSSLTAVSLETQDSTVLRAWLVSPDSANGNVVLLLHGLSDNRLGMIGYAELLLGHGYSVLMPDARAHGQSSGDLATYGLFEGQDIRDWVHWLTRNLHPQCVYGLGESMGAAQLLQSLDNEKILCAVIAESPFANLREIGYDRVGQFFDTGPWIGRTLLRPIIETSFLYSRWKYGLNLEQVSPESAVSTANVPVLLIHGQIDSNIPVRHSRLIKAKTPAAVLWEVPHADHCGAISAAPDEFERRVLDWFANHRTQ